jgi:hypothetical protein
MCTILEICEIQKSHLYLVMDGRAVLGESAILVGVKAKPFVSPFNLVTRCGPDRCNDLAESCYLEYYAKATEIDRQLSMWLPKGATL